MKCCKTCKWAKWERTKNGGIRTSEAGTCLYPTLKDDELIIQPQLPDCSRMLRRDLLRTINERYAIWVDDGKDCGCYEPLDFKAAS